MWKYLLCSLSIVIVFLIAWEIFGKQIHIQKASGMVATPSMQPVSKLDKYAIYDLVNKYRVDHGLKALIFDPSMCPFAIKRLQEIHTDYSHDKFHTEVDAAYGYGTFNENLNEQDVRGNPTNEGFVNSWINSPDHLKTVVEPIFVKTCVATDIYDGTAYAVQEFASN